MMRSAALILGLSGVLSDTTEELLITVTTLFSGIALLFALMNWYRVGKVRDLMLARSETRLALRLDGLEEALGREHTDIKKRLAELEEWRNEERRELLDTSDRLVHAMDMLRTQIHAERSALVSELKVEIRTVQEEWMRSIAKREVHKALTERLGKEGVEG